MTLTDTRLLLTAGTTLPLKIAAVALFLLMASQANASADPDRPPERISLYTSPGYAGVASSIDSAGSFSADPLATEQAAQPAGFRNISSGQAIPPEAGPPVPAAGGTASNQGRAENSSPDWDGIWRDTGLLFGSQIVAAGIIFTMPESVSSWSNEQKRNTFKKYAVNVVDPVIDKDKFYINYILHPYWGATYYIRGRERGLDKIPAFVYSALISAMYEFGVECFFERPSIQDLIVTPVAGSLLGAALFEPWRDSIKRKQELRWYDHAALVVTDPLGVLSLGIEKLFGIKSTIMVDYSVPQLQRRSSGSAGASKSSRIGFAVQFPLQ